jgi:tetratricopeptide (TPR) repeat protein
MKRPLYLVAVSLLAGWLGSGIPLTDLGFSDLAHGRRIASTGDLASPSAGLSPSGANEKGPPTAWMGSWFLYLSYQWGGEVGLRAFASLLGAGGAVFLYLTFPGRAGWLLAVLAAAIARDSWEVSTWLFSWPLIAGTLWILAAFEQGSLKWILLLPPLLVGWPNLNREAAVGFVLVGLAAVGALIEYRRQGGTKKVHRVLYLIGALVISFILAFFVVPGGRANFPNLISYGFLMSETGVPQWSSLSLPHHLEFFVFAVFLGALIGRLSSPGWTEKLTLGLSLLLTLTSSHFIIVFAAAAVYPGARSLESMFRKPSSLVSKRLAVLTRPVVLMGAVTALISPIAIGHRPDHPYESSVDVLASQKLSSSLFNTPSVGGLIRWKTDRVQFSDLNPASLALFDETRPDDLLVEMFREGTDAALVSWDFAEESLRGDLPNEPGLRLIYLDDSSLLYSSQDRGSAAGDIPVFEHFDPLTKPEEYPSHLVPLVNRELFVYLESFPPSLRTLSILGPLLLREGREIEALEVFEAASRIAPDDIDTLRHLSWLYMENGMYGLASETTRRAMQFDNGVDLVHNYARAIYGQGHFAEAVPYFERVLADEGENISALRALVDIHQRLDEPDLVKEYRERLDTLETKVAGEFLADAENKKRELDFQGAARAFRKTYDVLGDPRYLWAQAVTFLIEARNEDASQVLREIVRQRPNFAPAHLTLGLLCARKIACESEESKLYLEIFLELAPEDINADLARQELAKIQ